MLGDLFYEAKGRITSIRVLDWEGPTIENSYFLEGKMIGEIEVVETGTFTSIPTSDYGVYFVEGKDIVTVKGSNNEMATVKAQSISKLIRDSSSSKVVSGSNFYRSFILKFCTIILIFIFNKMGHMGRFLGMDSTL